MNDFFLTLVRYSRFKISNDLFMAISLFRGYFLLQHG